MRSLLCVALITAVFLPAEIWRCGGAVGECCGTISDSFISGVLDALCIPLQKRDSLPTPTCAEVCNQVDWWHKDRKRIFAQVSYRPGKELLTHCCKISSCLLANTTISEVNSKAVLRVRNWKEMCVQLYSPVFRGKSVAWKLASSNQWFETYKIYHLWSLSHFLSLRPVYRCCQTTVLTEKVVDMNTENCYL